MGSLNLPAAGLVYVDTMAVIYTVERFPQYWSLLEPLWLAAQAGTLTVATSELTRPSRRLENSLSNGTSKSGNRRS